MNPNVWLALPGVIACLGIVWLGVRLSSMEARISAPGVTAAAPAAASSSGPGLSRSAPLAPAAPQATVPTPAELDASSVAKFWKDTARARVMSQCRSGDGGGALRSLEVTLRIDATGIVLDARVKAADRAKASALYDCVVANLRSIQFPTPGKLVEGQVSLPIADDK